MVTNETTALLMQQGQLHPPQQEGGASEQYSGRVAIVGGGVSGISTARIFKAQGIDFVLYEASDSLSGVWSKGYPNFAIQTPGRLYEFPDKELPTPKDYQDGLIIKKYCEDYVVENDIEKSISLDSKVISITRKTKNNNFNKKWEITVELPGGKTSREVFDFVVLATGVYSPSLKYIPNVEGVQNFKGDICHSEDSGNFTKLRQGKKVLVVGFGKSAQDCAMNAYKETGVAPILLFRNSHWCVPRKVLGLVPMEWLLYSRFGQGTLPRWQHCGPVEHVFHTFLKPLIWLYWRIVEIILIFQLGLYGKLSHLRPSLAIEEDMYCGHGVICHPDFFSMARGKKIEAIKGSIDCIRDNGEIQLWDGESIKADEIVFATGFKREFSFLPKELLEKKEKDGFYAYRNMIVPGVPDIAFLNSNVTTFSNITTPTLQAAWLAEILLGNISLPDNMEELVQEDKKWRRKNLEHAGDARAYLIQLHQIRYWDSLLRDIGANAKRKRSGMGPIIDSFMNFFVPVYSSDYKSIATGEWKDHVKEHHSKGKDTSFLLDWVILVASTGLLVAFISSYEEFLVHHHALSW